jgi:prolipoprotein diacylglyceryltransferase
MAEKRLKPTTFDYALAAISPVLIILMIGSLVYFLILTLYRGEFPARLTWLFGLFTMASVLITRIAIEQSRTQSFVYLALLSAATLFVAPP